MPSILNEICAWGRSQRDWQRDALRRLVQNGSFDDADVEALYNMMLTDGGLHVPDAEEPVPLHEAMLPAPGPDADERITAVGGLRNVNRIASDQTLRFHPTGLTLVFGRNGAGKSGYTRILKKACRARRDEVIQSDAYSRDTGEPMLASFELSSPQGKRDLIWQVGTTPDPALSSVAVFDSACSRSFVSENGTLLYQPYGADVLVAYSTLIQDLKQRAKDEAQQLKDIEARLPSLPEHTSIADLVKDLDSEDSLKAFQALGRLHPDELAELEKLEEAFKGDAVVQAQHMETLAARIEKDARAMRAIGQLIGPKRWEQWKEDLKALGEAQHMAAQELQAITQDSPIAGAGSTEWKQILDAAHRFLEVHGSGEGLHTLTTDGYCPLCQQELGSAHERLNDFGRFLQDQLQARAEAALKQQQRHLKQLTKEWPRWSFDEERVNEYQQVAPGLVPRLQCYLQQASARFEHLETMDLHAPRLDESLALDEFPLQAVHDLAATKKARAQELRETVDQDKRSENEARLHELTARKSLHDISTIVEEVTEGVRRRNMLLELAKQLSTRSASALSKELVQQRATTALGQAMDEEFRRLGVRKLAIVKGRTAAGEAMFSLDLDGAANAVDLATVLSEGEQRVVGIACFLAELSTSTSDVGLLFDDPVSSLDHKHRNAIARRLVREARKRQVIIFTHDMAFLNELSTEAEQESVQPLKQCLTARGDEYGIVKEGFPFEAATVKDRIKDLNRRADAWQAEALDDEDLAQRLRHAYTDLRSTWEREVEEGLLAGVVQRYLPDIQTQRIDQIEILPQDVKEITEGMNRCNAYAHDRPAVLHGSLPTVQEFRDDVKHLAEVSKARRKHQEVLRKQAAQVAS